MFRQSFLLLAIAYITRVFADCQSYGVDFVDGGSYFQNISSSDDFTFISFFEGCTGEGSITPILVDPNEEEYFCSDIATSPDDTSFTSTCPIQKSEMFSGTWLIVIEGPDFAYTRTFYLTVGTPTTITATPTDTFGYTSTPDATTVTTTVTETDSTTAQSCSTTTTVSCQANAKLIKTTPDDVIVYSTSIITQTRTDRTITTSTSTIIVSTASCTPPPYPPRQDQKIVGRYTPKSSPTSNRKREYHPHRVPDAPLPKRSFLAGRSPDEATTTVTETTFTLSTTTTVVLPTPTSTETDFVTTTTTTTPICTVCSDNIVQRNIVTAPAPARTRTTRVWTTVQVTKTISIVRTTESVVTPTLAAIACTKGGGHM